MAVVSDCFDAAPSATAIFGLAIIHTAIQLPFSLYIMRNSFEAVPRESKRPRSSTAATAGRF